MNRQIIDYDFFHLGLSGGKDSTAVFLWVIYESGWPLDRLIVSFCDTDNEDALTYAYIEKLASIHPVVTLKPKMGFWDLAKKKKRFPSTRARFCTSHLKVIPSMKFVAELGEEGDILLLSGIRKSEGTPTNGRGNLKKFSFSETYGQDQYLPIYDMTIDEVWDMHRRHLSPDFSTQLVEDDPHLSMAHKTELIQKLKSHNIPRNPLYDMQAKRVGCFPCINSRKLEIRAMAKYRPQRIDFIEAKEIELGEIRKNGGSNAHYSPMFARTTVTKRFRSVPIVTKSGESMQVASIRDVVQWSKTSYGGRQYQMEFAAFDDETSVSCDHRGMCE